MNLNDRIVVIGAGGVLGTALKKVLERNGYCNIFTPSRFEMDCLNCASVDAWFKVNKPDYVFHLASLVFGLQGNLNNQLMSLHNNTLIAMNVFSSCQKYLIKKIFYAGTVAAYPYPFAELPLKEDVFMRGEPHPGEYGYAFAKRHALVYLQFLKESYGIDYCYGIFTNLYGENDKFDIQNGHVIPSLIMKGFSAIKDGTKVLDVWGSPSTVRDYLYSEDAATAAVHCMKSYSGHINIASGVASNMGDVADAIVDAYGCGLRINWNSSAPVGIKCRTVDVNLLSSLGFQSSKNLTDGISSTVNWFMENYESARS